MLFEIGRIKSALLIHSAKSPLRFLAFNKSQMFKNTICFVPGFNNNSKISSSSLSGVQISTGTPITEILSIAMFSSFYCFSCIND